MTGKDIRKDLIDYYKWNVSLATFVLTVSLSFLAFSSTSNPIVAKAWLYIGWSLLGICILSNWMTVKSLLNLNLMDVTLSSSEPLDEQSKSLIATIANGIYTRSKFYAFIQNTSFLAGITCTIIGLFFNLK